MKIMDNDRPLSHWQRIAEQNGISRKTFRHRLKRHTPRGAATQPLQNAGRSADPESNRQIALSAGLNEGAISQYLKRHPSTPLTPHQIAQKLVAFRAAQELPVTQQAKAAGLSHQMVYGRLKRGWRLEDALTTPPMSRAEYASLGGKARMQQKRQQCAARQPRNAQQPPPTRQR